MKIMQISIRKLLSKIFYKFFPKQDQLLFLKKRGLKVGKNFSMQDQVIIDPHHCWHITIGDDVTLAPRVYILAHDASTKRALGYTRIGKVDIGNNVFVGASSIILPGVTIGDDVIIGAGSIVSGDIPKNSIAVGNPAKVIDSYENWIRKREKEMQKYPRFGEAYTTRQNINGMMKNKMNKKNDR